MRRRAWIWQLAMVLFLVSGALASNKANQGAQIIEEAKAKNDIRELPSFEIKANVRLDNYGHPIDGTYSLLWNGTDRWRQEITFHGYSEIEVAGKETIAVQRTTDFTPRQINLLHSLMAYGQSLSLRENEKVQRIHDREINGGKVSCVEIEGGRGLPRSLPRSVCVDPSNGALARGLPFVDESLTAVGTKLFPLSLKYVEHQKTLVEVSVTELTTTAQFPAAAFDPPPGAVPKPKCDVADVRGGRLIKRVNPEYPPAARSARVEGTVELYAVIGTDGALHGLEVISGVDNAIDSSALEAVRQWRYEPYTCNGVPVEVESQVHVNYSLAH